MPGTDGGGEWGGAAFDPETALLYVNSNEQPWIIRMVTHDTTSLYNNNCASCHKRGPQGRTAHLPVAGRNRRAPLARGIDHADHTKARAACPASPSRREVDEIVDFLLTGKDTAHRSGRGGQDPNWQKYRNEGYILLRDPDGYPPLTPPWGTLNAIDLNKGEIRWRIPFGEYPEFVAKGITKRAATTTAVPWYRERVAVHRRHEFRQEVPRIRQTDGQVAVGNRAAGRRQCDAVGL